MASLRGLQFNPVGSLVDVKPQRLQLLLLCGGDHLLHLCQLLGFGPAGLQRPQNGLDSLGLLQQTPGSQEGKFLVRKKKSVYNNLVDIG